MRCFVNRTGVASATLLAVASLAAVGCSSTNASHGNASSASCAGKNAAAANTASAGSGSSGVAAAWTLPGANLQNTRDVASAITTSNVAHLGVAWCVPIESTGAAHSVGLTDGYSTTPIVVNGVVYTQD